MINWEVYEYIKSRLPQDLTPDQYESICKTIIDCMEMEPCEGDSQAERVYNHLQQHGSITNAEAHSLYGIRHLPSVIREVKKKYEVALGEDWKDGCNRFGESCRWKLYKLEDTNEISQKGYEKRIGEVQIPSVYSPERSTQINIFGITQ